MSMLKIALAASLATCLTGAAAAQMAPAEAPAPAMSPAPMADQAAPVSTPEAVTPMTPAADAVPGADASATVGPGGVNYVHIATPPVPDTPENRAKYGAPMSNAGKRTQPAGN